MRRRLRRSGLPYWVASLTLAGITGLLVTGVVDAAQARAARFGALREVLVTTRSVPAGEPLTDGDVERRAVPAALLPDAAPAVDAVGRAPLVPLVAGEVVVDQRLAPTGLRGAAALVPPGRRALAVPASGAPVAVGDHVDLIATFDDGTEPFTVASGAAVVAVDEDAEVVTVAVRAEDAPRVAYALAVGMVTVALTSDPPPPR